MNKRKNSLRLAILLGMTVSCTGVPFTTAFAGYTAGSDATASGD